VPDYLAYHIPEPDHSVHEYAGELIERLRVAHEILRETQWQVRQEDADEPPLYQAEDWVWMDNYRRCRGQAAKLQPKFVGLYVVVEAMPNHTYKLERSGQVSVQFEAYRRPPAYLQDFICNRVTSGRYESLAGCRKERLAAKRGS